MVPVNPPDLAGPRLIPNPIPEDPDFDDGACNPRGVLIPFVESYFSSGSFEGVIGLAEPIVPPYRGVAPREDGYRRLDDGFTRPLGAIKIVIDITLIPVYELTFILLLFLF